MTEKRLGEGISRVGLWQWGLEDKIYLKIIPTRRQTKHKLKIKIIIIIKHSFCLEIFGFSVLVECSTVEFQWSLFNCISIFSTCFFTLLLMALAVFYASDVAGGLSWAFSMAVPYGTDLLKKPNWK